MAGCYSGTSRGKRRRGGEGRGREEREMEVAEEGKVVEEGKSNRDVLVLQQQAVSSFMFCGTCSAEFMKQVFPRLFRPQSPRAAGFWCEP